MHPRPTVQVAFKELRSREFGLKTIERSKSPSLERAQTSAAMRLPKVKNKHSAPVQVPLEFSLQPACRSLWTTSFPLGAWQVGAQMEAPYRKVLGKP